MKKIIGTFAALLLWASVATAAEPKVLNVFNWSEYIPQEVLDQFTAETGIKVVYTTYESNEAMYAKVKLLQGKGYDIIVPSTYFIGLLKADGLLAKIDKSKLSNFSSINPLLLQQSFDPENDYSVPYMWGSAGLMVNASVVDPASITSWNDLFRPEFENAIILSDDLRDTFGMALKANGFSVNTVNEEEIKVAYEWLLKMKPSVRVFDVTATKQAFIGGEVMGGMSWNGDAYISHTENPDLVYIYPKEGVTLWADSFAIPVGAAHVDNAHAFIDFLLRPEIAKICMEEYNYTSSNMNVAPLLDEDLRNSRAAMPTDEDLANSEFAGDVGETLHTYEKYWEMLKTAN